MRRWIREKQIWWHQRNAGHKVVFTVVPEYDVFWTRAWWCVRCKKRWK